jgi:hypothetical protein
VTPPTAPERCTVCDRPLAVGGCPRFRASSATSWTAHEWKSAAFDCHAHRVDWRARALGLDALLAEERHIAAQTTARLDTILGKLGARDTGNGGQTIEAGDTRIFNDGMRRLDRAIADAARWRKVAPLIANLHRAALIGASHTELIAAVAEVTAATQEPTP